MRIFLPHNAWGSTKGTQRPQGGPPPYPNRIGRTNYLDRSCGSFCRSMQLLDRKDPANTPVQYIGMGYYKCSHSAMITTNVVNYLEFCGRQRKHPAGYRGVMGRILLLPPCGCPFQRHEF